jgi:YVTN family beta-propeller protein
MVIGMFLAGCEGTMTQIRTRQEAEGAVYLYLEPFPQEAERLSVAIEAIAAVAGGGAEVPLSVSLGELRGRDLKRQRLLAVGYLPAGEYAGFSFKIRSASLRREDGDAALHVPEVSAKVEFAFSVVRRKGYVLYLTLKYADSVGGGFAFNPAFSVFFPDRPPINLFGFVSNNRSNDITVFNKRTLKVFDVLTTGDGPSGMALDQPSRKAYVALADEGAIDVIDVLAGNISDRIRLYPGDEPRELALTPDGRTLLSANAGSNTVSVIDAGSRFEVAKIPVGNGPRSVAIEPTGRRAFVCNTLSNTVSVLDIPTRSLIATIGVDSGPVRAQFNRRGDRLYVIHEISPYVVAIHPQSLSVTTRYPVRSGMGSAKTDFGTDLIFLGRKRDYAVAVHEPVAFAPVGYVDTGTSIASMTVDGDENTLIMVSADRDSVLVANLISRRIVGEIDVGGSPYWVTVMGER